MDLGFTQEQRMLKETARGYLRREAPIEHVRAMEEDAIGFDRESWLKLGELGWLGLRFPVEHGGAGGSLTDLVALYEELGYALYPSPHLETVVLAGELINACGTTAQQARLLQTIASGDLAVSFAIQEPGVPFGLESIRVAAEASGGGWTLSGAKTMVPFASGTDAIMVVCRLAESFGAFLVDTNDPGLKATLQPNLAGAKLYDLSMEAVRVEPDALIGGGPLQPKAIQRILDEATVLRCAEMAGAMHRVVEMTAGYAKERIQFGTPVGTFQGVQWLCVDTVKAAHTAALMVRQAAWRLEEGEPARQEVAMAKAYTSVAIREAVRAAHEVFAGVGFIVDHDLQLYTRRARAWEVSLGDAKQHRQATAEAMGL